MKSILGFIFGLFFCLFLTALAGESPWLILKVLASSSFGSAYDLGMSLFYTTSFIFTGISVCLAFHSGLFNIGAEGQMSMGVLSGTLTVLLLSQYPPFFVIPFSIFVALVVSGFWGFIPGFLKAYRSSHEVIVTMMMNFIAAGIASYLVLNFFRNTESQNPETAAVNPEFMIETLIKDSPLNFSFLIAIFISLLTYFFLYKTTFGFNLRMSGLNEEASSLSGISSKNMKVLAMTLAGAAAGLVFLNETLGSSGKYRIGFSADYGFVGIAVALLARNNPIGILFSAFLFGSLQKGAADLDLETQFITRDFAKVLQAIIIFSVIGFEYVNIEKLKNKLWSRD